MRTLIYTKNIVVASICSCLIMIGVVSCASNKNVLPTITHTAVNKKTKQFVVKCHVHCSDDVHSITPQTTSSKDIQNQKNITKLVNVVKGTMRDYFPNIASRHIMGYSSFSPPQGIGYTAKSGALGQAYADVLVNINGTYDKNCDPVISGSSKKELLNSGIVFDDNAIIKKINNPNTTSEERAYALSAIAHELAHLEFRAKYPFITDKDVTEGFAIYYQEKYLKKIWNNNDVERLLLSKLNSDYKSYRDNFVKKYVFFNKISFTKIEDYENKAEAAFIKSEENAINPPCLKDKSTATSSILKATGLLLAGTSAILVKSSVVDNKKKTTKQSEEGARYCKCGKPIGHLSNCNPM